MSLRDLVTGSDMCSAGDGAGPSNAVASFANTLLGGAGKQQQQLAELPSIAAGPGPSSFAPLRAPTVEQAVHQASAGAPPAIPGLAPGMGASGDVDAFLREMEAAGGHGATHGVPSRYAPMPPPGMGAFAPAPPPELGGTWGAEFEEFDAIYRGGGAGPAPAALPPALAQSFQAFMDSGKARREFMPLPPAAGPPLALGAACRIRDRSAILARHLFAEQGDAFADEQVNRLLHSLRIDPAALPAQAPAEWDTLYGAAGAAPGMQQGAELAAAGRAAAAGGPHGWVDEFGALSLEARPDAVGTAGWAREYEAQQGGVEGWAAEFEADRAGWAAEFEGTQAASTRLSGVERALRAGGEGGVEGTSGQLAATLAADPKMRSSKFLQFVSKMSQGEIIIDGNEAKEVPGGARDWAAEFAAANGAEAAASGAVQGWADEFTSEQGWAAEFAAQQPSAAPDAAQRDWAAEFADGVVDKDDVERWAEQFTAQAEEWEREYASLSYQATQVRDAAVLEQHGDYQFAAANPFAADAESYAKAKDLFRSGLLSEAVLALEAEVQRNPGAVDAWRLLGTVHAENDDDRQAIAALSRALAADPGNLEVLLSLGVSHTNELDSTHALQYLHRWLSNHPQHGQHAGALPDSSQKLQFVVQAFARAAAAAPADADLHSALGVLHNLSRDFEGAATAFRLALRLRPGDYSLWNKLGATLANGNRSDEAVAAYQKALDAKPNYMRAWTNMGIAQANLGRYEESARYYARALTLNREAGAVWGYLRTSAVCAGRMDLMGPIDAQDVGGVAAALQL